MLGLYGVTFSPVLAVVEYVLVSVLVIHKAREYHGDALNHACGFMAKRK